MTTCYVVPWRRGIVGSVFTRLEFKDFRGFAHLDLQGLQRVNLICGQNNSGKTSLLEGIVALSAPERIGGDLPGLLRTAPVVPDLYQRWMVKDSTSESMVRGWHDASSSTLLLGPKTPESETDWGKKEIPGAGSLWFSQQGESRRFRCRVVSVQHRSRAALVDCFGKAMNRRGGEARLEELLRRVDPRLRHVRLQAVEGTVFIEVDLGLSQRLPLDQVGQGLSRLIAVFSEILGEAPDVCLIDEIENGLHHTLLPQIWSGIAAAARELDVQVFATTHSRECIEAAHEVFDASPSYDFSVIQLFRSDADRDLPTQGRVLDQRLVSAAMSGSVDLR